MTLARINIWFSMDLPNDDLLIKRLVAALPYIKEVARDYAEQWHYDYFNYRRDLDQQEICKYLINEHEYDAVEISKIVNYKGTDK